VPAERVILKGTSNMRRVVLLGASNLTLSFPLVVESLRATLGEPFELIAAHGHGRSYGAWSRVLFRGLPGVATCQHLWKHLETVPADSFPDEPPLALITDIGNDVLYGASVERIVAWVGECLDRLSRHNADVVMTQLPVASVTALPPWRYHATRMLFFPGRRLSWDEMRNRVRHLSEELNRLAREFDAVLVEPQPDWYGIDPIHIRGSKRIEAWRHIFSQWSTLPRPPQMAQATYRSALKLWLLHPAERRLFGRTCTRQQPCLPAHGGMTVSIY
jgi:hypothetical protein